MDAAAINIARKSVIAKKSVNVQARINQFSSIFGRNDAPRSFLPLRHGKYLCLKGKYVNRLKQRGKSNHEQTQQRNPPVKTILVVDDDPTVRTCPFLDVSLLLGFGKRIEGVQRSEEFEGEIHLFKSDFRMAGWAHRIATKLTAQRPQIKVLLMSGFSEGMLVLNEGWHFLAKPFVETQLRTLITGLIAPTSRFTASSVSH